MNGVQMQLYNLFIMQCKVNDAQYYTNTVFKGLQIGFFICSIQSIEKNIVQISSNILSSIICLWILLPICVKIFLRLFCISRDRITICVHFKCLP